MKESNPSQWHKNIKSMAGNKPRPPAIEVEGIDESDLAGIANTINRFFVSIAEDIGRLDLNDLPTYLPALPLPVIKPWDVYWELQHLSRRKAPGPDSIPARIISEFALELSSPLTPIFNESIRESVVPHRWKRAVVVPIPKTSKPTIGDLRPISLTYHFAKILEKFISKWLVGDIGSAIDKSQYGNRKGYSTAHYLKDILNTIHRNAENPKTVTTLVATDFSKAFDRIDHGLAVRKLLEMRASPSLVAWISSFLSNREQCVRYMSQLSDWMEISAGAPQGTRLGPLIFLCIIYDVFKDSDVQCLKYVDDLSLLECRKAADEPKIQEVVNELKKWTKDNSMKLNPNKCVAINIQFMRNQAIVPKVKIGDLEIKSIDPLTQSSAFTTRPVTTTEPKAPINYTIYIVMAAVVLLLILVICFLLCYVKKIKRPASSQNDTRNETTAAGERRSDGVQLDHAYDYPSVELRPLPSTQASIQYGTRIERTDDGEDRSDEGQLDHTYAEQPYMDII
eukprot:XP_011674718.1 PREDICTED: RNA-directed DNA polymerase from mobile element jockey-like [Strongylocentrotus purpuratus]